MRRSRPSSFSQQLPYAFCWSSQAGWPGGRPAGLLALKDGRLAVGFEMLGAAHLSASNAELNALNGAWAQWLRQLPGGMCLQVIVERGRPYDQLISDFAGCGPDTGPILRRGRQQWAAQLAGSPKADVPLTDSRTMVWLSSAAAAVCVEPDHKVKRQFDQAVDLLQHQALRAIEALEGHGIRLRVLGEDEVLAECFYAVNPSSPSSIKPPPASRPPGANLSEALPLGYLTAHADVLELGEPSLYARVLGLLRLSPTTSPLFWHELLWEQVPTSGLKLVVTHEAKNPQRQIQRLNQRRKWLHALGGGVFAHHGSNKAYEETEEVLERMTVDQEVLVHTSVQALLTSASLEGLDATTRSLRGALHGRNLAAATLAYEQVPGWLATLPANGHRASVKHPVLADAAAHLTPLARPDRGDEQADILYRNRQRGLTALSIRLSQRQDGSAIIIGKTGSGKTFFFSSLLKYGCLSLGGHAIIADLKGPKNSAYRPLCEMLGGDYIHVRGDHSVTFNPFLPRALAMTSDGALDMERLSTTRATLALMVSEPNTPMDDYVHSVLGDVLRLVYTDSASPCRPYILSDVLTAFDRYVPRNATLAGVAGRVRERLEFWSEDPVRRRLFNTPAVPRAESSLTVFDFEGFDRDPTLASVLMATLASRIETKMLELPFTTPKLFAFDEAWALFDGSPQAAALLNRLYRTARSYGACCYILTQSHQDIARSAAAQGVLSNLGLLFLMRHQLDHADVCRLFSLHQRDRLLFESLRMKPNVEAETLFVDLNHRRSQILNYRPTAFDLWCDSSKPQEVQLRTHLKKITGRTWHEVISFLQVMFPLGAPVQKMSDKELVGNFTSYLLR